MPRRRSFSWSTAVAAAGAIVLLGAWASTAAAPGWHQVKTQTPNPDGYTEFDATFVAGPDDAWVAGDGGHEGQVNHRALVEHWTGHGLTALATPKVPDAEGPSLDGLSGTDPSDIWAVGGYESTKGPFRTLIEHYDGTAWTQVASPRDEPPGSQLNSVSADTRTDVWAVGDTATGGGAGDTPLIEHFDGHGWTIVQGVPQVRILRSVTAISPTDVWAVGFQGDDLPPVIEHYDGTSWSQVGQPVQGQDVALNGISAASADDIWAVGEVGSATLVEHWDGTAWSRVNSPDGPVQSALVSVVAVNSRDAWAVGATTSDLQGPLAEHWNGTQWTLTQTPSPGDASTLSDVAAGNGTPVFAVGDTVRSHPPYLHRGFAIRH